MSATANHEHEGKTDTKLDILQTALNWQNCSDEDVLSFKEWLKLQTKCYEGDSVDLKVLCRKSQWVGEVVAEIFVKLPNHDKFHYLVLVSDDNPTPRLLGGQPCPENGCAFCR